MNLLSRHRTDKNLFFVVYESVSLSAGGSGQRCFVRDTDFVKNLVIQCYRRYGLFLLRF